MRSRWIPTQRSKAVTIGGQSNPSLICRFTEENATYVTGDAERSAKLFPKGLLIPHKGDYISHVSVQLLVQHRLLKIPDSGFERSVLG